MGSRFSGGVLRVGSYLWNRLYDRCVFEGVRFPDGEKYEDIYVTLKLLHNAVSFKTLPACKYYYVQRDGSIVHERGKVHIDILTARKAQLEQAREFSVNEDDIKRLEMLVVRACYTVYRDVLRLPPAEAAGYQEIANECKNIIHSDLFKQVPFSFKRRFLMKIWTAALYKLFWKWKRQ